MRKLPTTAEMDRVLRDRDETYDGIFFSGVRTTGVFCLPSCPARKPLAKNVEFFASIQDCMLAGYRPCKRCSPLSINGQPPDWVRRIIDGIDADPHSRLRDEDLRAMDIDPSRARRYFRTHYGMTFQAYHRAKRLGMALAHLRKGADMNKIAHDVGYASSSGFRDAFARKFGQPPGRGRKLDAAVAQWIETPLGPMVAAATTQGLCLLEFSDRRALEKELEALNDRMGCSIVPGMNAHLEKIRGDLARYFDHSLTRFTVPLVMIGTPFQQAVWNRLIEIPFGETLSYHALAVAVGNPEARRAVGTANGANKMAIVIPCHRVIRKSGELGGYGGGLWRKQFLLDLEQSVLQAESTRGRPIRSKKQMQGIA